jgi:hypothetical protein
MSEQWSPIEGYECLYEVSSFGRVRSLDRAVGHRYGLAIMRGRVLSSCTNKAGYVYVSLSKNCSGKSFTVHRLVAKAFLLKSEKIEVNHKDLNKSNNHVDNLEWASRSENHLHAMNNGKFDVNINPSFGRKLDHEKVRSIRELRSSGVAVQEIADRYMVDRSTIYGILNFKRWQAII